MGSWWWVGVGQCWGESLLEWVCWSMVVMVVDWCGSLRLS